MWFVNLVMIIDCAIKHDESTIGNKDKENCIVFVTRHVFIIVYFIWYVGLGNIVVITKQNIPCRNKKAFSEARTIPFLSECMTVSF